MQKMYVLWVFCRSRLLPEVKLCLRKYSLYALRIRYGKRCRPYFRLQSRYCCSRDVAGQASGGMLSGKDRDGRWCGCKQARPAFAAPLRNAAASKGSIVLRHTQSGAMSKTLLLGARAAIYRPGAGWLGDALANLYLYIYIAGRTTQGTAARRRDRAGRSRGRQHDQGITATMVIPWMSFLAR
jgi:hypothetical protein